MAKFLNKLQFNYVTETQIQLSCNFYFQSDSGVIYCVPKGFKSDGLSIPKGFRWFQKPFGFGLEGGVVHDYILECPDIHMSFTEANDIFDEALEALGMGWWKRNTLEMACNLNGWFVHGNVKPNNWTENQK